MPFCPKCRYEYREDVTECPDCHVKLVTTLPPADDDEDNKYENWVHLARLNSQEYSAMLEEAFREKGIPVVIQSGTGHFGLTGQMGTSSYRPIGGGYSVYIPDEFVKAADELGQTILGDTWSQAKLFDIEE